MAFPVTRLSCGALSGEALSLVGGALCAVFWIAVSVGPVIDAGAFRTSSPAITSRLQIDTSERMSTMTRGSHPASVGYATPLGYHVPDIVGLRSEEKMTRPDAKRVVAVMQAEHSSRDIPEMEYPRDSMGCCRSAVIGDLSVSSAGSGCRPFPAPRTNGHVLPKSELYGDRLGHSWTPEFESVSIGSGVSGSAGPKPTDSQAVV